MTSFKISWIRIGIAVLILVAALTLVVFFPQGAIGYKERMDTHASAFGILHVIDNYYQQNHQLPRLDSGLGAQFKGGNTPVNAQGDFLDGYGRPFKVFRSGNFIGIESGSEKAYYYLKLKDHSIQSSDADGNPRLDRNSY
jgi:hypothetical protein